MPEQPFDINARAPRQADIWIAPDVPIVAPVIIGPGDGGGVPRHPGSIQPGGRLPKNEQMMARNEPWRSYDPMTGQRADGAPSTAPVDFENRTPLSNGRA